MKKNISKVLLTIGAAVVVLLSSCSKVPPQSKHIPKEAAFVLSIDGKQIQEKLVSNGLTMDKLFEAVQQGQDTSNPVIKGFKEIQNSGLDIKSNLFVAVTPSAGNNATVDFIAKLDDGAKFEAYLKKSVQTIEIKSEGSDFKFAELGEGVVGWNKETVISVLIAGGYGDATKLAAKTELTRLFKLKESESANSVAGFKKLMKEKADVAAYLDFSSAYNNLGQDATSAAMLGSLKKLYEGAYYTMTANFENGKIDAKMTSYASDALGKIIKKYSWGGVDLDQLQKYPSSNIDGFMLVNFDLRMIGDIVKEAGLDGLVNMGMAQSGLSLDDVLKAFKGEIVAVASDFTINKKPSEWDSTYIQKTPEVKWLVALKVGEKAAFDKVMGSPVAQQAFEKQGDKYVYKMGGFGGPAVSIDAKDIIVASDEALQAEYKAGKGKATINGDILSEAKGKPAVLFVDIEKLMASAPLEEIDAPEIEGDLKGLFKDIRMVSNKPSGSTSTSSFVLNFKKQDQNSLVQLINFGTKAYKVIKAKEEAQRKQWESYTDSAAVVENAPVVVDTVVSVK